MSTVTPPNANTPGVNAVSVSFDPEGIPRFLADPDHLRVLFIADPNHDSAVVILWTLNGPASFVPGRGITLKAANQSAQDTAWPFGPIHQSPDGKSCWVGDHNNTIKKGEKGKDEVQRYKYSVSVVYDGTEYDWDPEVDNEPNPTITI